MKSYYYNIILIYNETYHVNKGVIVSISNTASIITLALPKSDNNNNNIVADDLQMYTSLPISCDSNSIQLFIFSYLTELTDWFSHNSLSLNMTKTDTIILSRPTP